MVPSGETPAGIWIEDDPNNQTDLCDMLAHSGAPRIIRGRKPNQSLAFLLPMLRAVGRGGERGNMVVSEKGMRPRKEGWGPGGVGFHRWHK